MKRAIGLFAFFFLLNSPVYTKDITFGLYTSENPSTLYAKFRPILDQVENLLEKKKMNLKFKLKIVPSYEKGIDHLVSGKFDLARFGAASFVLAKKKNKNIKLMVMENKKGKKFFNGVFITHKKSGVKKLEDLKSSKFRFAFGSKSSTIGRYLSQLELKKSGISASMFSKYAYLGRHDKVALAIINDQFDLGVVKFSTFKKYKDRGLVPIKTFPAVTKAWISREGLPPSLFQPIREALLSLKKGDKSLTAIKIDGFFEGSESDYESIKKAVDTSRDFSEI